MEPLVRNQLMYLSKDQFRAVRSLLQESRHRLDEQFYYGPWEGLLKIDTEEDAYRAVLDVPVRPPGFEEENNQVIEACHTLSNSVTAQEEKELCTAMAGDTDDASYVDLFVENQDGREAEYEQDEDDDASQATPMSFEQWEQRNADALPDL
eukprot:6472363-Amphidinium_carterae.1